MGAAVSQYFGGPVPPMLPYPIDPLEAHINHFFDHIVLCVNQRRETVLTAARDKIQELVERNKYKQQSESQLLSMKTGIECTIKENKLQDTQDALLKEVERKLKEVRGLTEYNVIFRGNSAYLELMIAGLGEVIEEEMSGVPRYEDMRPIVAAGKEGKAHGRIWFPVGVAIDTNNNHIYVAESELFPTQFSRISIFSDAGLFISSFSHVLLVAPQAIAIDRDNIYVANVGGPALIHFNMEPQIHIVAVMGEEGIEAGEFDCPSHIAVSPNGDLYITESNNHRIQVFNAFLHYVRKITHESLRLPIDIKLAENSIYVLCEVSPCIHVFSYAGEKIRSLITRGDQMQVITPSSLCIDQVENIIITDMGDDKVKIFSKNGSPIQLIGETGHQVGKFRLPKGLAIIDNHKLVVLSLNTKCRIQIFSNI